MKQRPVRGTHDIFGNEILKFNKITQCVRDIADRSSFNELKTPIFEFSSLFSKPLGEQSDVVLKEMYTFEDRNNEFLTLRPEYTTPMIRAAISNNFLNDLPCKLYGFGPMFRRERPQKGRYRQFNQINFEIFGSNDPYSDVELIYLANCILKKLLPDLNLKLNLNTLGKKEELNKYKEKLNKYFNDNKEKLSDESKEKINNNPLRILDSKNENDERISRLAPLITEFLSKESKDHFVEIKNSLTQLEIPFVENANLVRGLDYYCHTVFEFKTDLLGSQDTVLGGGRYDGLISILGGADLPGVGWAAGIERLSLLMQDIKKEVNDIHIAIIDKQYKLNLIQLTNYLNINKFTFYWNYKYNLKKSLSKANEMNAKFIIIIGDETFKKELYSIKDLTTGEQIELSLENIKKFINDKS